MSEYAQLALLKGRRAGALGVRVDFKLLNAGGC